jgi:uncharacterized protein (DUF302 family)
MHKKLIIALFALLLSTAVPAVPPGVYVRQTDLSLDDAYNRVYKALEANKFWVVFEADLAARMARFADKWGDDYNRQGLSGAKSMVFCNIWWTNRVAGADPAMLSLCPLHLSLYTKDGKTSITLLRPSVAAQGSGAEAAAAELEQELIGVIEGALQ